MRTVSPERMSLPCGCEPSLEGGYGDDGTHSRYSMEWCPLHAKAQEMRDALKALVHACDWLDEDSNDANERRAHMDAVYNARALLAEIEIA